MQYDNPALDVLRVGPGLAVAAYTGLRQLYDIYTATEMRQLTNDIEALRTSGMKKEAELLVRKNIIGMNSTVKRPRSSSGSRQKRFKKQRTNRISSFSQRGPHKDRQWLDTPSSSSQTFTSAGAGNLLNGTVVGTDYYHRRGHNITITSIHLRGHIAPLATNTSDRIAYAIVFDRQANGTAPVWGDVFQNTDSGGSVSTTTLAQNNIQNSDRFLVLRHETLLMPSLTVAVGVETNVGYHDPMQKTSIDFFKKLSLPVRYDGDTGAIADIVSGSIYLLTIGSTATAGWSLFYSSRIRFVG